MEVNRVKNEIITPIGNDDIPLGMYQVLVYV